MKLQSGPADAKLSLVSQTALDVRQLKTCVSSKRGIGAASDGFSCRTRCPDFFLRIFQVDVCLKKFAMMHGVMALRGM